MSKGKKSLILITNHFPYGQGEAFLLSEMPHLVQQFDKVIVLARDVKSDHLRPDVEGFSHQRINPQSSFGEKLIALGLLIRHFSKINQYLSEERRYLRSRHKKVTSAIRKVMWHDLVKAITTAWHIRKAIREHQLTGEVVLYSYWLTSSALALTFVDDRHLTIRSISRAHGGDVHEFRNALRYLSFRYTLAKHLDHIYTISENGKQHLQQSLPAELAAKISVSRLGSKSPATVPAKNSNQLIILSCAFMVAVKRIDLLIESLAKIEDLSIRWIHIGSGPLEDALQAKANTLLSPKKNITYSFEGHKEHHELMAFYQQQYVDLFVNTSSSEGIPVTMMEAQSFGIPVLAPAVGGIPEIVDDTTGRLFQPDATPDVIAHSIKELLTLPAAATLALRENARKNWLNRYNADQNFSSFVAEIANLS
jgi:glycosyltransferase involved in cell wall biosynthesis